MAGDDRWEDDRDRYRREDERGRDAHERHGRAPDRFDRFDRESFARGEGFGRESRDFPGGRDYFSYGHDRDSMGRPEEPGRSWDSEYRSGSGRQGGRGEWSGRGRREAWGRGGERGGPSDRHRRSVGEMAFGRDQSGHDQGGDFGRRHEPDRGGWFGQVGEEVASWFGAGDDEERIRRLDLREAGQHRGRGPKSYQRSDARILEDINDRLTDDPQLDASDIEVSVAEREATLSGTVSSRRDKRRAEDLADSVSGVTHVQNNLRVRASGGGAGWSDDRVAGTTDITGIGSAGSGSDKPRG